MNIITNSVINPEYFYDFKTVNNNLKTKNIYSILKINQIKDNILNNKVYINKFGKAINYISGYFCKRTNINTILTNKINNSELFNIYSPYLGDSFKTKSVEEVIKFLYIEYFILIDLLNFKLIDSEEFFNILNSNNNTESKQYKNSDLLTTNKQSFELTKANIDLFIKGKNIQTKKNIVSLFNEMNISLIEIPNCYNVKALYNFLNDINSLRKTLKIKEFNFNLRFKKLKLFKKDGMYIVNAKTIILDPRKTSAFIHELGHYIYEEKIDYFIKANKNLKIAKNNLINKSKLEDYSEDSENFAYWFENVNSIIQTKKRNNE